MARYLPTPDIWNMETRADLDAGRLILQPGQWIQCGPGARSRFHRFNRDTGHIVAFHGPVGPYSASAKYRAYLAGQREEAAYRIARAEARETNRAVAAILTRGRPGAEVVSRVAPSRTYRVVGAIMRKVR